MPSYLTSLFRCGSSDDVKEPTFRRPSLTKIRSPLCGYATDSMSPDFSSPTSPINWSQEDSPNWSLHRDYLQLQNEKSHILDENLKLRCHGAELLALIEYDQNMTALLKEELAVVKSDLNTAIARNTKLEHRAYFTPLEGIFSLRTKAKEAELKVRRLSVQTANEEFVTASLQDELSKCREERDQAKDMLDVEKHCKMRDNRGEKNDSLFSLEIKAAALLHQARYMSRAREETRQRVKKRVMFLTEEADEDFPVSCA